VEHVQAVQYAVSAQRANPANANGSLAVTTTQPVNAGVLRRPTVGGFSPSKLRLWPFGTGSDNGTHTLQVVGWQCVGTLWFPSILYEATVTLSTFVGASGGTVTDSERFCDTIATTSNKGNANVDAVLLSPADNTPAHVVIDVKGSQFVEVRASSGGNALYAWL
jgi:hypothetical protein